MFTINIYLKLAIIAVCFIGGGILTAMYGFGYTWILFLIGIVFLVSYILLGTVQSTAELVQRQEFEAAEKRLGLTLSPKLLYVVNRAFYYIIKGSLSMQDKKNDEAEDYFQQALDLKLPSDNERGMVLIQLANINAMRSKWNAAKNYHRQAKKLKITEQGLKDQILMFERNLQQSGTMKSAGAGRRGAQMMRPGGKRRRPKMR